MQALRDDRKSIAFLNAHLPTEDAANYTSVTSQKSFLEDPGIVAPFLYDAVIGIGLAACNLRKERDSNFSGKELFDEIMDTTFEGTSGSIVFDPQTGTREPESAPFSLTNFVASTGPGTGKVALKGVTSDLYQFRKWISLVPYTFNDGTSNIPPDLPALEVETNYLSTELKVAGSVLCGTIIAMAVASSIWTRHYRKKRVVRAAQPIFLQLISAGTLLMGCSIIPLTIDEGTTDQQGANIACMSFPWLLALGFSLTFSALFTKTHRINQVSSMRLMLEAHAHCIGHLNTASTRLFITQLGSGG